MANKTDLEGWVEDALRKLGGKGKLVDVAKQIWEAHNSELSKSGDIFFTWQYDMRWAANRLRRRKIMRSVQASPNGIWELE